ncbi:3'(2'),5'-bisphosphate nucleotidase CysQ [uncultured Planktosalinus sp.]|uniref:3'(2'),5'-bisphosphate nucleotidase CysQ n=1 Tax=uncultured Planktosalinus sp. TaxID=1810935 RepID=UPI0030DD4BCC
MNNLLNTAIEAALLAGKEIMQIYARDFEVEYKDDASPLTAADQAANTVIVDLLSQTAIPIISEENKQLPYSQRKAWNRCWIVDPLDGTKEFIKKNDEFTVNIALIEHGKPVMGVILVPAENSLYYAVVEEGKAFRVTVEEESDIKTLFAKATPIAPQSIPGKIRVVGSRSHMNEATLNYVEQLKGTGKEIEIVSKGSSLKLCMLAEGAADVYPRFAPTMEWDTAAGHAICSAVGIGVQDITTGTEMRYNKENLLNNHFLVSHE